MRRATAAGVLVLVGLAAAVYAPVAGYGFVAFDDDAYLYANPDLLRDGPAAAARYALTTTAVGNWNPLLWGSYFADRGLLGLRPGAMHVENVALHAATGLLLWLLWARMTAAVWRAYAVAVLFVVHPAHVESVAWLSERKDVLSTPLLLGAMLAYVRYVGITQSRAVSCGPSLSPRGSRSGTGDGVPSPVRADTARLCSRRWWPYAAMLALFAASLLVKPMGVTLPAMLLLLDVWPLRRTGLGWRRLVAEKLPLVLVAAAASVTAMVAQRGRGAVAVADALPVADRLGNAAVCYCQYVAELAVPTDLAVLYPHPGSRPVAAVAAAAGLLVLVTVIACRLRGRRPYLLVGWLWFLGTLVPVVGLVQIGQQAMADRYAYLPSVGVFVAVVWGVAEAARHRVGRAVVVGVMVSATVALSALAFGQVRTWRDTRSLFAHAVAATGTNGVAHLVLGNLDRDQGRATDALAEYRQAVAEAPGNPKCRVALAAALAAAGRRDEAVEQLRRAVAIDPTNPNARAGLADLLGRP